MGQENSSQPVTTVKSENSNDPHAYYDYDSYPDDAYNSTDNSPEPHAYYD